MVSNSAVWMPSLLRQMSDGAHHVSSITRESRSLETGYKKKGIPPETCLYGLTVSQMKNSGRFRLYTYEEKSLNMQHVFI